MAGRGGAPGGREGGAGDGQPEHAQAGVACTRRSPPERARRIAERLEIHHTPKHGSWLNMAEIELAVLARQCLDRRIESMEELRAGGGGVGGGAERAGGRGASGGSPRPTPGSSSAGSTPHHECVDPLGGLPRRMRR